VSLSLFSFLVVAVLFPQGLFYIGTGQPLPIGKKERSEKEIVFHEEVYSFVDLILFYMEPDLAAGAQILSDQVLCKMNFKSYRNHLSSLSKFVFLFSFISGVGKTR